MDFDSIAQAFAGVGSAISSAYSWARTMLGLNNRPAMKDNAEAARDEQTAIKVDRDFAKPDPTALESDLDPGP